MHYHDITIDTDVQSGPVIFVENAVLRLEPRSKVFLGHHLFIKELGMNLHGHQTLFCLSDIL